MTGKQEEDVTSVSVSGSPTTNNVLDNGETVAEPRNLLRDLQGRHMQMIAVGELI